MNYQSADAKLTGRNRERRKLANNTYLERRGENIAVRLHETDVLTFAPDGSVTLDSGGWKTVTTKARMNEYLGHGLRISQSRGQWYVYDYSKRMDIAVYADGMRITSDGKLDGCESLQAAKDAIKLRARVQRYAAGYVKALFAGKVPKPDAGDCFYCLMREVNTGKPLGECTKDHDHLMSHIEEKYYVPSLLQRAFETGSVSHVMRWAVAEKWYPEQMPESNGHSFADDYTRVSIQKVLSRYMLRQLGQAA